MEFEMPIGGPGHTADVSPGFDGDREIIGPSQRRLENRDEQVNIVFHALPEFTGEIHSPDNLGLFHGVEFSGENRNEADGDEHDKPDIVDRNLYFFQRFQPDHEGFGDIRRQSGQRNKKGYGNEDQNPQREGNSQIDPPLSQADSLEVENGQSIACGKDQMIERGYQDQDQERLEIPE